MQKSIRRFFLFIFLLNFLNIISENNNQNIKIEQKTESNGMWDYLNNAAQWSQNIIQKTSSNWVRLFLVFILGFLMSFTPCIYPIIPITVGILQLQGSKSLIYNFFLSLFYSLGIATTFALFGLTAAFTGHLFGQILVQPVFVIFICAILIYLALSMFGIYDMYVPAFLTNTKIQHKGSLLSAFIFGAVSGSIASPCLSPGLALLLTIVATLANKLLGFLLLFSFGIGLSIPLLIIGTFSSSLNILPQAGHWMNEIKKIFGFMLFAMVFYYLKNILPENVLLWLLALFALSSGIYYFNNITSHDSKFWKLFKNLVGSCAIIVSLILFTKAFKATFETQIETEANEIWQTNYDSAKELAKQSNKKLLIDIGATYCTICKAIDKYVFNDPKVKEILTKYVPVKVDATDTNIYPYNELKTKYDIIGIPTILIVDAENGTLYKKWQSELYNLPKEQVIQELEQLSK